MNPNETINPFTDHPDERQIGGLHYKKCPPEFQHWNLVRVHNWDYFQAQSIKYIMRYKEKAGIEDLEKALHFVEKMIADFRDKCANTSVSDLLSSTLANPAVLDQLRATLSKNALQQSAKAGGPINSVGDPTKSTMTLEASPHVRIWFTTQDVKNWLNHIRPDAWVGLTFEGADAQGFLYTCKSCHQGFYSPEGVPPPMMHTCGNPPTFIEPGTEPGPGYVNQG